MRYCKNCLFPDTKPELEFNENGICSACISSQKKEKIDWSSRKNELSDILKKYKINDGSNYY